ncbi:hypothetical protein BH11PSE11_BH11PSE11_21080 [soil metagenome]
MDEILSGMQWPAMLITLVATWLVGSRHKQKRAWGFWCFLASNLLWMIWGWHDDAYALIGLQIGLLALNIRGAFKSESREAE